MKIFSAYFSFIPLLLLVLVGCETESKPAAIKVKDKETEYKDSTIEIKDKYNEWDLTPKYKYQTKDQKTAESVTYEVIGKKDGFGITGPFPIVSNEKQKYFWFYWGEENIKDQPVQVMAYQKGSKEIINIFSGEFYEAAQINENEVNMPSNLNFPSAGVWNILVFINDELSGNIVVEVVLK